MNGFLLELHAKTKVDMRNMYREKYGLTRESLVLPEILLLSNIETDRGYLGKEKNHNSWIYDKKSKRTEQTGLVKKITEKVSDIRFMCNINYTWMLQLPHTDGSDEDQRNKKSDPLLSSLWLNQTNICSTGRDSVIQIFSFSGKTSLPPIVSALHIIIGKKARNINIFQFLFIWINIFSILSIQELDNRCICLSQPMTSNNTRFVSAWVFSCKFAS